MIIGWNILDEPEDTSGACEGSRSVVWYVVVRRCAGFHLGAMRFGCWRLPVLFGFVVGKVGVCVGLWILIQAPSKRAPRTDKHACKLSDQTTPEQAMKVVRLRCFIHAHAHSSTRTFVSSSLLD